jgi:hypothetical protein
MQPLVHLWAPSAPKVSVVVQSKLVSWALYSPRVEDTTTVYKIWLENFEEKGSIGRSTKNRGHYAASRKVAGSSPDEVDFLKLT